jgi:hypothetical protein
MLNHYLNQYNLVNMDFIEGTGMKNIMNGIPARTLSFVVY